MSCSHPGCDSPYLSALFRIDGSTMWGFHIGIAKELEPEIIATKGNYKTKNEAQIAASAFIAGILFHQGDLE